MHSISIFKTFHRLIKRKNKLEYFSNITESQTKTKKNISCKSAAKGESEIYKQSI